MATGKRLSEASEDVTATGRVMSYQSEMRGLQQFEINAKQGLTYLTVSTTALDSVKDVASQAFNLAPAAASSGDPTERAAYATQVDGYLEQAFSLANTQINGTYLFGAEANNTAPFTATRDGQGHITAITYTAATGANGSAPKLSVDENTQIPISTSGTENQQLAAFLNHLITTRDAITANNPAAVGAAQNAIGDDETNLVSMLGGLSASLFRIKSTQTQNSTRFNQLANLSSSETDTDMAETIIKFQASQRSYQGALQAGSKILQQSLLDYI
jgi:flagellar hook-associated protein 3 FlgL